VEVNRGKRYILRVFLFCFSLGLLDFSSFQDIFVFFLRIICSSYSNNVIIIISGEERSSLNRSHGVFTSPFSSQFIVLLSIRLINSRYLGDQWIIRVWITQKGANWQKYFGYRKRGWPLRPKYIKTNASVAVDVRMVYSCCESYFWWFEGIICREMNS